MVLPSSGYIMQLDLTACFWIKSVRECSSNDETSLSHSIRLSSRCKRLSLVQTQSEYDRILAQHNTLWTLESQPLVSGFHLNLRALNQMLTRVPSGPRRDPTGSARTASPARRWVEGESRGGTCQRSGDIQALGKMIMIKTDYESITATLLACEPSREKKNPII